MATRAVPAGEFKAKCLKLLDDVAAGGPEIVVTKRGRAVAKVVPIEPPPTLRGSVTYLVEDDELVAPIDLEWDALA